MMKLKANKILTKKSKKKKLEIKRSRTKLEKIINDKLQLNE